MKKLAGREKFLAEQYKKLTLFYQNVMSLYNHLKTKSTAIEEKNIKRAVASALEDLNTNRNYAVGVNSTDAYYQLEKALVAGYQGTVAAGGISGLVTAVDNNRDAYLVNYLITAIRNGSLAGGYLVLPDVADLKTAGFKDTTGGTTNDVEVTRQFKKQLSILITNLPDYLKTAPAGLLNDGEKKAFLAQVDAVGKASTIVGDINNKVAAAITALENKAKALEAGGGLAIGLGAPSASAIALLSVAEQDQLAKLKVVQTNANQSQEHQSDLIKGFKANSGFFLTGTVADQLTNWVKKADTDLEVTFTQEDGTDKTAKLSALRAGTPFEQQVAAGIDKEAGPFAIGANITRLKQEVVDLDKKLAALPSTDVDNLLSHLNTLGKDEIKTTLAELKAHSTSYDGAANSATNKEVFKALVDLVEIKDDVISNSNNRDADLVVAEAAVIKAVEAHEAKINERITKKYGTDTDEAYYASTQTLLYQKEQATRLAKAKVEGLANDADVIPPTWVSTVTDGSEVVYDAAKDRPLVNAHLNLHGEKIKDAAGADTAAFKPTIELDEGFLVDDKKGKVDPSLADVKARLVELLIGATNLRAPQNDDGGAGALSQYLNANAGAGLLKGMKFICKPDPDPNCPLVYVEIITGGPDGSGNYTSRQPKSDATAPADPAKSEKAALAALASTFLEAQMKLRVTAAEKISLPAGVAMKYGAK